MSGTDMRHSEFGDDGALLTFNEIASEIGSFQVWTSFLIILSGVSVSWQTLSAPFTGRILEVNCIKPPNVNDHCSDKCLKKNITQEMKTQSILYQWNLLCENDYKEQLAQTVLIAGMMCGCLFYGHAADQLGRRPTFLSACMLVFILGIIVGLSPWYWFFCLCRFIEGIGCGGMAIICVVFLVEYVELRRREFMVIMYRIPYTVGHSFIAPMAYFVGSWRHLQVLTSSFAVIYISYFWLIPESPRWLFITGQLERCIAVLRSGAVHNKRPTEKIRVIIERAYDELRANNFKRNGTMVDLFKTVNLGKNTCVLLFGWFTSYLLFYGVLDYLRYMKGDLFKKLGIVAWVPTPSTLLAYPIVMHVTRRYSLLGTFGLSSVFVFIIPFLPHTDSEALLIAVSSVVVALMSITFCILHVLSSELYPTILRNSGMGLCICCGRFGCLLAPYFTKMYKQRRWLPGVVLSCFSACAAIALLFMPETKGEILSDTIEESVTVGKRDTKMPTTTSRRASRASVG